MSLIITTAMLSALLAKGVQPQRQITLPAGRVYVTLSQREAKQVQS